MAVDAVPGERGLLGEWHDEGKMGEEKVCGWG